MYVPASRVSALCDRNPFSKKDVAVVEWLKMYNKDIYSILCQGYNQEKYQYEKAVKESGLTEPDGATFQEKYQKMAKDPRIKGILEKIEVNPIDLKRKYQPESESVKDVYDTIKDHSTIKLTVASDKIPFPELQDTLQSVAPESSSIEDLPRKLQRCAFMERGTNKEHEAINLIRKTYQLPIEVDNKHLTRSGKGFKIGGRIDGYLVDENGKRIGVVEVKNRVGGFKGSNRMPGYDVDQLAVYWFLTQLDFYAICEMSNGKVDMISYDPSDLAERWKVLEASLEKLVDEITHLRRHPGSPEALKLIGDNTLEIKK